MKKITSFSDFLRKAEKDITYKKVLVAHHSGREYTEPNYQRSLRWMEDYIKVNVGEGKTFDTCEFLITELNAYLPEDL